MMIHMEIIKAIKKEQKKFITEIMNEDAKDGLYGSKKSDKCTYCKGKGKIFYHEFGQFVKCEVCQSIRAINKLKNK